MAETNNVKYDDMLGTILENENSILGFLSTVFNFLARRTDFYYVPDGQYENMGFPPGVAEELVIKVLRSCDPKSWKAPNGAKKPSNINNEIMCSTVAQEVEIYVDDDDCAETIEISQNSEDSSPDGDIENKSEENIEKDLKKNTNLPTDYSPPVIPVQKNSEAYNGAVRDKYSWSQTIMDLDAVIKLPPNTKSKDLKVTINPGDICVKCNNGEVIIEDTLPYKIKTIDSFWSISEGRLLMHLEKVQERWWNKFLNGEEEIDLSKIDCSRSMDELPEDHIAKIRELQWNQERKLKNLPTSDELRNIEILRKAWNAEGSPFKGTEFDPSILKPK